MKSRDLKREGQIRIVINIISVLLIMLTIFAITK